MRIIGTVDQISTMINFLTIALICAFYIFFNIKKASKINQVYIICKYSLILIILTNLAVLIGLFYSAF